MVGRSLVFLFASLGVPSALAQTLKSAHRDPSASYLEYKSAATIFGTTRAEENSKSPAEVAVKYSPAAIRDVTEWESLAAMSDHFHKFRDFRFLSTDSQPDFLRRSSWLYPDDGCFARAALAVLNLARWQIKAPDKIFVFGDLRVKTPNSPEGEVTWWYHVAPIVQVEGRKYVLDPALDPRAPLPLEDWLAKMSPDIHELEVAVCQSGSYTPDDVCNHETDGIESQALADQPGYLSSEWSRLEELHRNPNEELGDSPPWFSSRLAHAPAASF